MHETVSVLNGGRLPAVGLLRVVIRYGKIILHCPVSGNLL